MIFETWDELKRSLLIRFGKYDNPERIKILREEDQRWKTLANSWNHSNEIAESSNTSLQVQTPMNESDDLLLGYRRNHNVSASSDSLLTQIEFPVFDGFMPYCWIRKVEKVFRSVQYGEFLDWSNFKKRLLAHFAPAKSSFQSEAMMSKEAVSKNAK